MIAKFDIFKYDAQGGLCWLESANDLIAAETRVKDIGSAAPGEYLILNQSTGNRFFIQVSAPNIDGSASVSDAGLRTALEGILGEAIQLSDADFGNIQLLHAEDDTLRIAAHRGFSDEFLRAFAIVYLGEACACGTVLRERKRIVVSDVMSDPLFAGDTRKTLLDDHVRSVQSMPLSTTDHQFVGVLSVHYRSPQIPIARRSAVSDSFLVRAADLIHASLEK